MVALREEWSDDQSTRQTPAPEGARWMSIRHASCRLNVCPATLRRRMRKGELPWRVVHHGRRWSYEVLVPGDAPPCTASAPPPAPVSMDTHLRRRLEEKDQEISQLRHEVDQQEQQIEYLSQALVRARSPGPHTPDESPFARYRQLVAPRRRWWFFRSP